MASFNQVTLVGNLTRDPQLRHLPNQTAVVDFGLAITDKFKGKDGQLREDTCFVDCTCFGKAGETINQYCQKGKLILVSGRLKYDSWEDKNGAGKRSKLKVVVETFQFLGDRQGARVDGESRQESPAETANVGPASDDDIPF